MTNLKKLLYIGFLVSLTGGVEAAKLCVNEAGSGKCYGSIQDAVDDAVAGDTIKIRPGTYFESVDIPSDKTGLTLKGSKKSIIDSHTLDEPTIDVDADNVSILGLAIRNGDSDGIDVDADGVRIVGVDIRNSDSDCININGDDAIIQKSVLLFCGSEAIDGDGDGFVIHKNDIRHCDSGCIDLDSGDNSVITKNRIEVAEDGDCVAVSGDNVEISSNKVTNCADKGIDLDGDDGLLKRNRVVATEDDSIEVSGDNPQVIRNRLGSTAGDNLEVTCEGDCSEALVEGNHGRDAVDDESCMNLTFDGDGAVVSKNIAQSCADDGFDIDGDGDVLISKNRVMDVGGDQGENGFDIDGDGTKTLMNNIARHNSGDGFDIGSPGSILTKNKAFDNAQGGINLGSGATGAVLTSNIAKNNLGEGISVFSNENTLTGNKAKGNRSGFDYCEEIILEEGELKDITLVNNKFASTNPDECPVDN